MASRWGGCWRATRAIGARLAVLESHKGAAAAVETGASTSGSAMGLFSRGMASGALELDHTSKWMHNKQKKSPMQLINEVPPIEIQGRIVACEGARDPALGHPVEYICLDLPHPAVCKYCGLRYVQQDHH